MADAPYDPEQLKAEEKALRFRKERLRIAEKELAIARETKNFDTARLEILVKKAEYLERSVERMDEVNLKERRTIANLQAQEEKYENLLKGDLTRYARKNIQDQKEKAAQEAITKEIAHMEQMRLDGNKTLDKRIKKLKEEVEEYEMKATYEKQSQALAGQTMKLFGAYKEHPMFNVGNAKKIFGEFQGALKKPGEFAKTLVTSGFTNIINSMISLALQMDAAEAGFVKTTGASKKLQIGMREVYKEVRGNVVSMDQLYATAGELTKTFTDFTQISDSAQQEVAKITSTMIQAGHSATALSKDMQLLTVTFGMMGPEATATLMELDAFARDIGVPPAQLTEQFGVMGEKLAKLGDDSVRAFKEMARVSKITGFEMSKMLDLTDKFDTFENAAKMAGGLNAALGGNFVNAMEMMTATDPVERFTMIRDSLKGAGLEFDNMSYYQRKFFKEQLGLADMSDLAAIMRGDMESLDTQIGKTSDDYEAMADRAREAADFTQRLKAMMQQLIPVVTPLIDGIEALIEGFEGSTKSGKTFSEGAKSIASTLESLGKALMFVVGIMGFLVDMWPLTLTVLAGWKLYTMGITAGLWGMGRAGPAAAAGITTFITALVAGAAALTGPQIAGLWAITGAITAFAAMLGGYGYILHGIAEIFSNIKGMYTTLSEIDFDQMDKLTKALPSEAEAVAAEKHLGIIQTAVLGLSGAIQGLDMGPLATFSSVISQNSQADMDRFTGHLINVKKQMASMPPEQTLALAAMSKAMGAPGGGGGTAPLSAASGDVYVKATIPVYLDGTQIANLTAKNVMSTMDSQDKSFGADRGISDPFPLTSMMLGK